MNGFKNSSSSVVLLPFPPPSSSHSSTPFYIISFASKFPVSALIPQFRVTLINHQTVFSFQSLHKTGHRHFLRYFHQYMHWSGHPFASTFLISNFTAFANFFLSLVFFLHRISFCDSLGQIRCGSCYSSLYALRGRLCDKLFTSFIAMTSLCFLSCSW